MSTFKAGETRVEIKRVDGLSGPYATVKVGREIRWTGVIPMRWVDVRERSESADEAAARLAIGEARHFRRLGKHEVGIDARTLQPILIRVASSKRKAKSKTPNPARKPLVGAVVELANDIRGGRAVGNLWGVARYLSDGRRTSYILRPQPSEKVARDFAAEWNREHRENPDWSAVRAKAARHGTRAWEATKSGAKRAGAATKSGAKKAAPHVARGFRSLSERLDRYAANPSACSCQKPKRKRSR